MVFALIFRSRQKDALDKKYFMWGLYARIFGGLFFALIYVYNYGGGDTINYWHSAKCLINLSKENFNAFFHIMGGSMDLKYLSAFTPQTGYPLYRHDVHAFMVNKLMVPFVFLGAKRFLLSTLVVSFFMYLLVYRFYRFLKGLYPAYTKEIAIAILFVPSVVFWSSGILKDSLTFAFSLLTVVALYHLLIKPQRWLKYLIFLMISAYVILNIKPYIFYALFAAFGVWLLVSYTNRIQSSFLRFFVMPFLGLLFVAVGLFAFSRMGESVGGYYSDMDSMAKQAAVIQNDLKQDYYGGNTFDIGDFEPTPSGMLKKSPKAITAGLYRPFLWESRNILMLLSGLENIVLLLLSLYIIIRVGIFKFIKQLLSDPFLMFCLVFSVILAFFIGLTTSNFGSLVRYRIPLLPFFVFMLLIVYQKKRKRAEGKSDSYQV